MREDYLRIAVLAYMQQGGTVLLRQLLDIAVAYERGELFAELPFPSPKIGYISHSCRKHVTFPQQGNCIPEKTFLGFAPQRRHILGPSQQLQVPVVVTETHEAREIVEILPGCLPFRTLRNLPQLHHIASGKPGQRGGLLRLHAVRTGQPPFHVVRSDGRHPDLLNTGEDGGQEHLRGHRDQQEKRFVPRLLQYLQQTVRGLHSHLLRQPYHHRLVLGLERLKREFAYDFIRLAFGDEPLLIVEPNPPVPHLLVEIAPRRKHRLPPLGQKGIAHGFLRTAPGSIGREDEMHVRMNQFRHLDTRRTPTATVAVVPVRTVDILYIGQREGQRSPAAVARKELGMAYTPLPDTAAQHRLHLLLSYDIRKPHALLSLSAENGICAASPLCRVPF